MYFKSISVKARKMEKNSFSSTETIAEYKSGKSFNDKNNIIQCHASQTLFLTKRFSKLPKYCYIANINKPHKEDTRVSEIVLKKVCS